MNLFIRKVIRTVGDRLKEPSTYAGLSVLVGITGYTLPEVVPQVVVVTGMFVGGLITIFVPEVTSR